MSQMVCTAYLYNLVIVRNSTFIAKRTKTKCISFLKIIFKHKIIISRKFFKFCEKFKKTWEKLKGQVRTWEFRNDPEKEKTKNLDERLSRSFSVSLFVEKKLYSLKNETLYKKFQNWKYNSMNKENSYLDKLKKSKKR